ncbi:hypothetical protein [Rossellomorea sp. NPDC077527]|uniref:hypothetical protein n=1 Tax=Rossellomorea sp. NPDC077527 TaxID=3364510 RepID=UPI0037CB570A
MEIKREKTLTHLFFSGYTSGFVVGGLFFFSNEINIDFQLSFSKESFFCLLFLLPIIYWFYRYVGIVFNNQRLIIKLLYFALFVLGIFFGILFFEFILN